MTLLFCIREKPSQSEMRGLGYCSRFHPPSQIFYRCNQLSTPKTTSLPATQQAHTMIAKKYSPFPFYSIHFLLYFHFFSRDIFYLFYFFIFSAASLHRHQKYRDQSKRTGLASIFGGSKGCMIIPEG